MKKVTLEGKVVEDTFQHQVFQTYDEAMTYGTEEMDWNEDEILDRTDTINLRVEGGEIDPITLNCITVDTGSVNYLYYID